ncbi:hypothetical protein RHCH11_RHCH11_03872 [Beijerinckiaceae bacterium RH CH11]|nr:hypothetical protein RHCH11_RHCH11_03872 [Beijerinckiaceae bacterium RH CH11]VVB49732.1 hypothetical protein RHAL8_03868 [Beijerinckiaceae bacterium RH AL8]
MKPRVRLAVSGLLLGAAAFAGPAVAADLGLARAPLAVEGLPCEAPAVQAFDSVWLGHFSGGYSHYLGPGEAIVLDWRDEKLCFQTKASCDRYMRVMRRDFHRPEGYFTCLPIR